MRSLAALATTLWLAAGLTTAWAAPSGPTWTPLAWPQGIQPQVIAEDMRLNGRPVRLYQFETRETQSALRDRLMSFVGPHARVTTIGQREVIAGPVGGNYVTVDLHPRPDGGVVGYVMQTDLDAPLASAAPAMPIESTLWSHTESRDGTQTASVAMLENRHSLATNSDFYERDFKRQGLARTKTEVAELPRKASTMHFAGNKRHATVVVEDWDAFRTVIVNEIREDQ